MEREPVLAAVLALLALLALGVAAATLDDPAVVAGDGFGFGSGAGGVSAADGDDDTDAGVPLAFPSVDGRIRGLCLDWLRTPWAMAGLFLLVAVPAAYVSYRSRWLLPGVAFGVALGGPLLLIWLALTTCGSGEFGIDLPEIALGAGFVGDGSGGGAGAAASDFAASQPSLVLGLVLALAVVLAAVLLIAATGDVEQRGEPEPPTSAQGAEADVSTLGAVAGDAADRIDDGPPVDVDNEVYAAWVEMTDHLSVSRPESSTPTEFATAAVEAGMGAEDVAELTGLFEEVRYGDYEATPARADRALAALRRIESAYAASPDRDGR